MHFVINNTDLVASLAIVEELFPPMIKHLL